MIEMRLKDAISADAYAGRYAYGTLGDMPTAGYANALYLFYQKSDRGGGRDAITPYFFYR
jgi:hypothetical protein